MRLTFRLNLLFRNRGLFFHRIGRICTVRFDNNVVFLEFIGLIVVLLFKIGGETIFHPRIVDIVAIGFWILVHSEQHRFIRLVEICPIRLLGFRIFDVKSFFRINYRLLQWFS